MCIRDRVGTAVNRDYATFSSMYGVAAGTTKTVTLTASRHIQFLAREIPGDRGGDYRAFLRAVQNDEAQGFVIVGPAGEKAASAKEKAPAAGKETTPTKP